MKVAGLARFLMAGGLLGVLASTGLAEVWICKQPGGSEVYSDHNRTGQCRKLNKLPQLIPAPVVPPPSSEIPGTGETQAVPSAPTEPEPQPIPGGGRAIDPPSFDAITVHDLKATPNYNSTLGIATYQADMRLQNEDSDWTAEKVCIDVRFRDIAKTFIDVEQTSCLEGLRPMDDRGFRVLYTGSLPPRLSPIQADVKVSSVKWAK